MKKNFFFFALVLMASALDSCKMSCTCQGSDARAMRLDTDEQLFFNCKEMTDYYHKMGYYDVLCE